MKLKLKLTMIVGLVVMALMAQLVLADWGIWVWRPNGAPNGGPGYVQAQQVSSMYGGWRGYTEAGGIIESHMDHTGQPGGPGPVGGCGGPGIWPPCRYEFGPTTGGGPSDGTLDVLLNSQDLAIHVMQTWIADDPITAIKYAEANAEDGVYGATTAATVANLVAQSDLDAGMQFAKSLPAGMARDLALRDVAMVMAAKQGRDAANAWLESQGVK